VAAILIIYFGGGYVKAKYDDYIARKNAGNVVNVDNQALAILQGGGSAVDALEAAMNALNAADTNENIEVANKVRGAVVDQVNALIDSDPWQMANLDKASQMTARALQIDPDTPALRKLGDNVKAEVFAYKMSIKEINAQEGTVKLRVLYPDQPEDIVEKKKGDKVLNRFEVKSITRDGVRMSDTQRKGKSGLGREIKIFTDGTIKPA
jgi:hypothetical protein